MQLPQPTVNEIHLQWAAIIQAIRHQQANDIQVVQGYLKMNQPERVQQCMQSMMARINQERALQSNVSALWLVRLLPLLYLSAHLRLDLLSLAQDIKAMTITDERAWQLSGCVANCLTQFLDRAQNVAVPFETRAQIPALNVHLTSADRFRLRVIPLDDRYVASVEKQLPQGTNWSWRFYEHNSETGIEFVFDDF
jgi:Sensor_kinase_SpoOB-type, alpha-helical domain